MCHSARILNITFTLVLATVGCAAPTAPDEVAGPSDGKADDASAPQPLQIGDDPIAPLAHPSEIQGVAIEGNVLVVDVAFGGGCESHDFELLWDGFFLETLPLQVNLVLTHDDNGDFCEAFLREQLRFDLTRLAEAHAEAYPGDPGPILLRFAEQLVPYAPSSSEQPSAPPADPSIFQGATLEGDQLLVDVAYPGGCAEHVFDVQWDGRFLESYPVQTHLMLTHDDGGDACEAFLSDRLTFDLSWLRESYQSAYGDDGPLVVHLFDVALTLEMGASDAVSVVRTDGSDIPVAASSTIADARIDGHTLELDVTYGGGCETQTFDLHWDGRFLETYVVQASLTLHHDDGGDRCEAFLHDTLRFDLTPLAEAHRRSYGEGAGEMTLRIDSWRVNYRFE